MPLLKLQTSVPVPENQRAELLAALSKIASSAIGKPELYVMAAIETGPILMSGQPGPAAFADVRSIGGLGGSVNTRIAKELCALLQQKLGIPPERVFLNFTEVPGGNWGWNGETIG